MSYLKTSIAGARENRDVAALVELAAELDQRSLT